MTLSSSNEDPRRTAARARRQDYDEDLARRRPWILPTLVTAAVVVVAGVVVYWIVTGSFA